MNPIHGDGIQGLWSLRGGSVQLVLSDLPSGATKVPFDKPPDFEALWPAVWNTLKPNGTVVFMASSFDFAQKLVASQHKYFRYDLVWHKSLATGHLNAKHRPLRAHEYLLVFFKGKGVYNPQMVEGAPPIHAARRAHHGQNYGPQTHPNDSRAGATDRHPTSVLEFSSVGTSSKERKHPQQKPVPLLEWCIKTFTKQGALVADPFAGSGSSGVAARNLGRRWVGWDLNPKYGRSREAAE